ncbi:MULTISPECIES: polysaccharide deacetylase family protein [unclassified Acinetobacter]|uniref:polysaccharide deacetylase family protein n=1 Tax=unclassified Acinetobacter TaxID=196816 RepID=UPI0015D21479|nr:MULTISPECIES: polysaccharide deacetylase family protein [unclassified Acinetobacter]
MADQQQPVTREKLINADIDVDNLGKAVNEETIVTPRYGDQYKSAPLAIKEIEDNGIAAVAALNAKADQVVAQGFYKGYTTEALLLAAKPAVAEMRARADDTRKIYRWNRTSAEGVTPVTGTWVDTGLSDKDLAAADATTKANAAEENAKAYVNANDGATRCNSSAFYDPYYYNANNNKLQSANAASTDLISVKSGDVVSVFTKTNSSGGGNYPAILVYDASGVFVRSVQPSTYATPIETTTTITEDGFIRSQWMGAPLTDKDGVAKVVINEGAKRFIEVTTASANPTIAAKAEKVSVNLYNDFVLGYVNVSGDETESTIAARSPVYKMLPGTVINFSRPNGGYFFGVNTSQTAKVPHNGTLWINNSSYSITISESAPYVRFFLRNQAGTALDLAKAIAAVKITNSSDVAYKRDVDLKVNALSEKISQAAVFDFNSLYRTPSLATGGVVSFIDDDGKAEVYSGLYPFMKSMDVPFGAAIVPTNIGQTNFMTMAQLQELHSDEKYFEVLNHAYTHANLVEGGLTTEQKHQEVYKAKQWCTQNGFEANGFVLPYGKDDAEARSIVQMYYPACYDYDGAVRVETFTTIRNELISRTSWGKQVDRVARHKALVDQAAASNGWLVICTHVSAINFWDANSYADLTELINYIKSKGCKIMKPRDAFQTFGNIVENDSGFKITANGKIVGAS